MLTSARHAVTAVMTPPTVSTRPGPTRVTVDLASLETASLAQVRQRFSAWLSDRLVTDKIQLYGVVGMYYERNL